MPNNTSREACREVLQILLTRKEGSLEKLKVMVCRKYGLNKIPSNADILAEATDLERERVLPKLRL
ncbi:MAG: hypothetical protein V3S97_09740, partial [Candidatus Bathyarchaeia archaeon]